MTDLPAHRRPTVVIPAHGRGSRLRAVTRGGPKTLSPVGGQSILGRLLQVILALDHTDVVVYQPVGDRRIAELVAGKPRWRDRVTVREREPQGYANDLAAIAAQLRGPFIVLDSDLVTRSCDLHRFLRQAWRSTADLVVAVTPEPPSSDPRSLRFVATGDGRIHVVPGHQADVPRALGAYRWGPKAVAALQAFVAAGRGTFHDFVRMLAARGFTVELVEVPVAFNVNTPDDLEAADTWVRRWADGRDS